MKNTQESIPTTKLYEAPDGLETPEQLFVESIVDRSRLHQFKIKAHRHHGLHQIFFLTKGEGKATIDTKEVILKAPCLLVVTEMSVHDFDWQPSIEGFILTLSTSLCHSITSDMEALSELFLQTHLYTPKDNLAEQERLFKQLYQEFKQLNIGRKSALEALVFLILIGLLRSGKQHFYGTSENDKRARYLHQFTQLIEQHYQIQQPVSFYAEQLSITPTHLNTLCRELTGRSSLALIHERLLLEIKRSLLYSDSTISEISWALNFSEPAYFSRFFKRMTGASPKQFRSEIGQIEYVCH